jgi:predicted RNase H-like HicB family nuclease
MSDLQKYLNLPYTVVLRSDEDGDIVARIQELPGCSAHGKTDSEALENIREAQRLWIEDAIETGDQIPVPESEDDTLPSGKWVQRAPRSLHKRLIQSAKKENVSLNQFVNSICSEAVGRMSNMVQVQIEAQTPRAVYWGSHQGAVGQRLDHPSWDAFTVRVTDTSKHNRFLESGLLHTLGYVKRIGQTETKVLVTRSNAKKKDTTSERSERANQFRYQ